MYDLEDTITALATPPGHACRGIVRITGPRAWLVVHDVFQVPPPDRATTFQPCGHRAVLRLPKLHAPVPASLYWFLAPRSFTGQDLVEVHTLGSPPILQHALHALIDARTRQALPGEFTARAFLLGKLDLTVAEAIAGLVDARSARQADVALRQMAGGISLPITQLRDELLDLLAELEAGLDFADEDLDFIGRSTLCDRFSAAAISLIRLQAQMSGRSSSTQRKRIVLAGAPNAGKSTLFNALLGHEGAIVSREPGTTRDYLIGTLPLPSGPVELIDTAGLENASDPIGRSAQDQAERAAQSADLVLWCVDRSGPDHGSRSGAPEPLGGPVLVVHTKSDLVVAPPRASQLEDKIAACGDADLANACVAVSAKTGTGIAELRAALDSWVRGHDESDEAVVASTAVRCEQSIAAALAAVERAGDTARAQSGDDLIALELRLALDELGRVVGAVYTDDLLDRIFSRFCIGK